MVHLRNVLMLYGALLLLLNCDVSGSTEFVTECLPGQDPDALCYKIISTPCLNIPSSDLRLTSFPVRDLLVTSSTSAASRVQQGKRSNLTVIFALPAEYQLSNGVAKFEIRITTYSRQEKHKTRRSAGKPSCVLLDVHGLQSTVPALNDLKVLYHKPDSVGPSIYLIQVLNLSPDGIDASPYLIPQAYVNVLPKLPRREGGSDDMRTWTVDTVVQNDSCNRTVSVQFQLAPEPQIRSYRVMLVYNGDRFGRGEKTEIVSAEKGQSCDYIHMIFYNVSDEDYVIKVEPDCYAVIGEMCWQSVSAAFTVHHPEDESECRMPHRPMLTSLHISAVVIGCVTTCIVLVAVALLVAAVKCGSVLPAWKPRRLLIIYEADCTSHVDVVCSLTNLLQTRCKFEVISELTRSEQVRRSKPEFVLDSLDDVDLVLIVVSEGLRADWKTQRNLSRGHLPTPTDAYFSVGDLLLQNLRRVVGQRERVGLEDKIMSVRFDYTPASSSVDREMALGAETHELPRDIGKLLMYLAGLRSKTHLLNFTRCTRPPAAHKLLAVDEVQQLADAVELARQSLARPYDASTRPCTDADGDGSSLKSEQTGLLSSPDDDSVSNCDSKLGEDTEVTRQQLVQADRFCMPPPDRDDVSLRSERPALLHSADTHQSVHVSGLASNPTSGYVSRLPVGSHALQSDRDGASLHAIGGHSPRTTPSNSQSLTSSAASLNSLAIDERISRFNDEYDVASVFLV